MRSYTRHIDELRKLWRKLTLAEHTGARMAIEGAGKALIAISARWPAAGAPGVAKTFKANMVVGAVSVSAPARFNPEEPTR